MRAMEARDALRGGAEFPAVVAKYSDERGAATRAGSIGTVERKDLAPHVADAAFELGVGEFSDVVESEYGFHVVMRTE
jgi:parvulin-like peptidyl-prolyl isomerase